MACEQHCRNRLIGPINTFREDEKKVVFRGRYTTSRMICVMQIYRVRRISSRNARNSLIKTTFRVNTSARTHIIIIIKIITNNLTVVNKYVYT